MSTDDDAQHHTLTHRTSAGLHAPGVVAMPPAHHHAGAIHLTAGKPTS